MGIFRKTSPKKSATAAGAEAKKVGFIARLLKQRAARRQAKEAARIQKIKDDAWAKAKKTEAKPAKVAEKAVAAAAAKAVEAADIEVAAEERRRIAKMAAKAAALPAFVKACERKGLNPRDTFIRYYDILSKDEAVIEKEMDLQDKVAARQEAGENVRFSRTAFYAKRILERFLS